MSKIKVMIADDQRLMREGLQTILSLEDDLEVVGTAENGRDALKLALEVTPDVVLMDIRMPVMDGVECTGEMTRLLPDVKIIILTTFDEDQCIVECLQKGARGYLLKDVPSEMLVQSVRDAYRGVVLMQPQIAAKLISQVASRKAPVANPLLDRLTRREMDVLELVSEGLSNKDIARKLYISEGTVKNYISVIYEKLGVKDRTQAVLLMRDSFR